MTRTMTERRVFLKGVLGLAAGLSLIFGNGVNAAELTLTRAVFEKIEREGSRTTRKVVSIDQAEPGEELSYVTIHHNASEQLIQDIVVITAVPKELEYMSTSIIKTGGAHAASFEVSVDGGKQYGILPQLVVATPSGESRRAKSHDVTHVRWSLQSGVAAGEDLMILLRGHVRAQAPVIPPKEIPAGVHP